VKRHLRKDKHSRQAEEEGTEAERETAQGMGRAEDKEGREVLHLRADIHAAACVGRRKGGRLIFVFVSHYADLC